MSNALTIVMGYRDREPERVRRCLASLASQTRKDFVVHLVDYGSSPALAGAVRTVAGSFTFCRYIYTDTRGWHWSRSRALNVGIRMAETEWVMTTDVDMVFATDFIDVLLSQQDGRTLVHCSPHWLPERFEAWEAIERLKPMFPYDPSWKGHKGGCQCFPLNVALQLRGFDEYYRIWGYEDGDFADRLAMAGLHEQWVDDRTTCYHQWHPSTAHDPHDLAWALLGARVTHHYAAGKGKMVRNDADWGHVVRAQDRPVYAFVDSESRQMLLPMSLVELDYDPADSGSTWRVFEQIAGLSSGAGALVARAGFPSRSARKDLCMTLVNRVLGAMGISLKLAYPPNLLHVILDDFIAEHQETVADVFFGCGPRRDCTVIVRR